MNPGHRWNSILRCPQHIIEGNDGNPEKAALHLLLYPGAGEIAIQQRSEKEGLCQAIRRRLFFRRQRITQV